MLPYPELPERSQGAGILSGKFQVVAAVVEHEGRYLLCRRPDHKRHGGLWEFPGGKVEEGETFVEALRRELKEELLMNLLSAGEVIFSSCDDSCGLTVNFLSVSADGEPALIEHSQVCWVSPAELKKLALAPVDRKFAEHLMQVT
jgi:mutator protein MutT